MRNQRSHIDLARLEQLNGGRESVCISPDGYDVHLFHSRRTKAYFVKRSPHTDNDNFSTRCRGLNTDVAARLHPSAFEADVWRVGLQSLPFLGQAGGESCIGFVCSARKGNLENSIGETIALCKLQSRFFNINHRDGRSTNGPCDGGTQESNRSSSCNQDVLTAAETGSFDSMDRDREWLDQSTLTERDGFRKCVHKFSGVIVELLQRTVDRRLAASRSGEFQLRAEIVASLATHATFEAGPLWLHHDTITDSNSRDVGPDGNDVARELMPQYQGILHYKGAILPRCVVMQVCATKTGCSRRNLDLAGAWKSGGDELQAQVPGAIEEVGLVALRHPNLLALASLSVPAVADIWLSAGIGAIEAMHG